MMMPPGRWPRKFYEATQRRQQTDRAPYQTGCSGGTKRGVGAFGSSCRPKLAAKALQERYAVEAGEEGAAQDRGAEPPH